MKKIFTGMSAGPVLSVPVSFIPYVYICTITGGILIITAVFIYLTHGNKSFRIIK